MENFLEKSIKINSIRNFFKSLNRSITPKEIKSPANLVDGG